VACLATTTGLFVTSSYGETKEVTKTTITTSDRDLATLQLPPGVAVKDLNVDKGIEKSFKAVTEDAMSKSGFDNLVACLADQDKDRIKGSTKSLSNVDGNSNKALTDIIADLDGAWKSKYGKKFDLDYKAVFNTSNIKIISGEVTDPNALIGKWPLQATPMAKAGGTMTPSDAGEALNKNFGGRVNLEKGRKVAVAHLTEANGIKGVTASLIDEHMTGWTFDIPNTIDARRLYDSLVANLSYINAHRDLLPADINQGYFVMSQAVTAALYDVDLSQAANRSPTAGER